LQNAVFAQKELPVFGKIDLADLELKDCPFDAGASAFKLIDLGKVYFLRNIDSTSPFFTMHERRVRIKILKSSGLIFGNLHIPFFSAANEERIIKIEACTFNLSEGHKIRRTIVQKSSIYNRRINKQSSEMTIVFPEVKVGSVIEYKYLIQKKSVTEIKDWYFQSNIPTKYSSYEINIPSIFHFTIHPLTADSLEMRKKRHTDRMLVKGTAASPEISQKIFIMRNLPAVQNEPYMGSARDYMQRLSFRLIEMDYGNGITINANSEWNEVVTELNKDPHFGSQLNQKLPEAADLMAAAKAYNGLENKMTFLYQYIQKKIQWNEEESIYSFKGIKKTFIDQSGSSGDLNLLLLSLLNQAGIKALPVLFSTRNNGLVNTTLPFISQFNTVMVLVATDDKEYLLDAANKNVTYHLKPEKVLNTKGFVVMEGTERWLEISDSLNSFRNITAISAYIDTSGTMKGDVLVSSSGYARKERIEDLQKSREIFMDRYFKKQYPSLRTSDLLIENVENDALALEQKIPFSIQLNQSGPYQYFNLNMFSGLEDNPFIAAKRQTDIEFGYLQEYRMYANFSIPANYFFEQLPQDISLIMPDTSIHFKRFITTGSNEINIRISIDFNRSWFSVAEYPEFAAFYKILLFKLNEQVVLRKKEPL